MIFPNSHLTACFSKSNIPQFTLVLMVRNRQTWPVRRGHAAGYADAKTSRLVPHRPCPSPPSRQPLRDVTLRVRKKGIHSDCSCDSSSRLLLRGRWVPPDLGNSFTLQFAPGCTFPPTRAARDVCRTSFCRAAVQTSQ